MDGPRPSLPHRLQRRPSPARNPSTGWASAHRPGRSRGPPTDTCPITGNNTCVFIYSGKGPPTDLSMTISVASTADILRTAYTAACDYLKRWSIRGILILERGQAKCNLHERGVAAFGLMKTFGDDTKLKEALPRQHHPTGVREAQTRHVTSRGQAHL